MSQGFVKLFREKGIELLEADPQAFLLLTQIAMRARRTDREYSMIPLKANQAFLGDHKKAGLSRQQYRNAQKRLAKYGLSTFEPTNKGTIATLTSTEVYDINAEPETLLNKPTNSSMKTEKNEPTQTQQTSMTKPINIQREFLHEPVTRREEPKKETTSTTVIGELYECLEKRQDLTAE